ncbi:T9SS type A sorting domain-containing protein [candidate division KSB1 bacterium]|nr:T9SS type A sorting domain-containing protein [candidate division KSB1 bacterium]
MNVRYVVSVGLMCLLSVTLNAQNLIRNGGFDDNSEWQLTYHIQEPVSDVIFGYTEDTPAKGQGPCLYVGCFGTQEARPVIYQEITCIAGETYFITGAIKVINLDLPAAIPPGPWFQIYANPEAPPDWYDGMGDWNPGTKVLNISAWSPEGCELYDIDGFWEDLSCENDAGNNLPYFTVEGTPGTPVPIYIVIKPGLWLNEGDSGGFEILIDNVGVYPLFSNLIKNWSFEDDSEWEVTYHIQEPVSEVVFGYSLETPVKGQGSCLYVGSFGAQEVRPVFYQGIKCIAGEPYRVSGAIKIIDLDLPATFPPGPWFQIYANPEAPPDWYDGMGDWNPSTKLLNISAWSPEGCELYDIDGFWENLSCENDWGDNLPYFTPEGDAGTEVDIYIVMKPGLWLNEGTFGGFEVVIDNIAVYPVTEAGVTHVTARDGHANPEAYILEQNFPNPFNPETNIVFTLPQSESVTLEVYDVLGKKVATLLENETKSPGHHHTNFKAVDLPTGLYFCKMQAGGHVKLMKMMLVK